MEHKLINGGEEWLPFARSRIKALRATGLEYASQKFEIDGCSVRVQLVGEQEFIWIEGAPQNVWAYPSVVFPVSLNPDGLGGYVAMSALKDGAIGKLRLGQNTTPSDAGPPTFRKFTMESGVSPYSLNNLTAAFDAIIPNTGIQGAGIRPVLMYAGKDIAFQDDGVYTRTPSIEPTSFFLDGYVNLPNSANTVNEPFTILAKSVAQGGLDAGSITSLSMSTDLVLFRATKKDGVARKPDGSIEQELTRTTVLSESSTYSGNFLFPAGEGGTISGRRYFGAGQTDKYSRCVYASSPSGAVFLIVQRTKETAIFTGSGVSTEGKATGEITTALYKTTETGKSKRLLSTFVEGYKATADRLNVTSLQGKPPRAISIMPGVKKIGIVYQNIFDSAEYWLDIIETEEYSVEKQIPVPAWPGTFTSKLDGGAGFVGNYLWCAGFCLNAETGEFLEIPGSMKPSTALTVPGAIFGTCDYLLVSKDGKKATYYWLNITEAKRPFVTSGGNAYPLKDGHLRSYEIKEIDGVETVVDVSPSPNTKIIGTNKILSGDTNGAALLFKKGGGK